MQQFNSWVLRVWQGLLTAEDWLANKTQKRWDAAIHEVAGFMESPAYGGPDLPDWHRAKDLC